MEKDDLPRDRLLEIVADFPHSQAALRKATIKLALRRHVIETARWEREAAARRSAASARQKGSRPRRRYGGKVTGSTRMRRVDSMSDSIAGLSAAQPHAVGLRR